jgi:hypothetical protein
MSEQIGKICDDAFESAASAVAANESNQTEAPAALPDVAEESESDPSPAGCPPAKKRHRGRSIKKKK